MEFDRSLCVLPSHGPPFSPEDELKCEGPPRALKLSSGNIGSVGSESTWDLLKPEAGHDCSLGEAPSIFSTRTTHTESSASRVGERRRRRQRRDGGRQYPWQRDRNFIRYELDSERYRAYRLKSRQSNDQVWPDDVEDCLQYALRVIPVLGRKKDARINFNNQQGGRNELIRDFIFKWTGQDRGRKQVSSHLQVLKGYLSDNKAWMQYVTPPTKGSKEPAFRRDHECDLQDITTGFDKISRHAYMYRSSSHILPPPTGILGSNVPPSVVQVDLEIFLNDATGKRLHTFTSIQSDIGSGPRHLEDVFGWRNLYPDLACYYQDDEVGQVDPELILLEMNIDVLHDHPNKPSTLGINPFIVVAGGIGFRDWRSVTHLYEKGTLVRDERKGIKLDDHPLPLEAENLRNSDAAKVVLQMKSSWWANNVIAEILNRTTAARAHEDQHAVYEAERWGRRFLADMSMMQEIYATPKSDEIPRRLAILLWKFRQTEHSETATTTWRKLEPPYPRIHLDSPTRSPTLPFLHPPMPMAIDTSLQYELSPQRTTFNDGYMGQSSFFVDDPESIITGQPSETNSASSTPTPDSQSLPSSTATSFASSGSGSLHHSHQLAASSAAYHDPIYLPQEWHFDSQQSMNSTQDSEYLPDDLAYESQSAEYPPQRPTYPDPSEAYPSHGKDPDNIFHYNSLELHHEPEAFPPIARQQSVQSEYSIAEHQPHPYGSLSRQHSYDVNGESPFDFDHRGDSTIAQDFTGGQIHISFAEHEQRQYHYDPPLVAPEADMLSAVHSCYGSQQEAIDAAHAEPEASSALHLHRRQSHYSASQDLEDLESEGDGMELVAQCHDEQPQPHEQPFAIDQTVHHSQQQGELILHHPQPHQSLQHHLDSAQWQTHELWANINKVEDEYEEPSPAFDTEILQFPVPREAAESVGPELQESGHIIGEISASLERDIEEIERDIAREIRRDLSGVELRD